MSASLVQPPSGSAEAGFATEQRPPGPWFNWIFNATGAWLDFLRGPQVEDWRRTAWGASFNAPSKIPFDVETSTSDAGATAAAYRFAAVGENSSPAARMHVSQRGNVWAERTNLPSGVTGPFALKALSGRWLLGCLTSLGAAAIYYTAADDGAGTGAIGANGNAWSAATMPGGEAMVESFARLGGGNIAAACATEAIYSADNGATWSDCTFATSPGGNGRDVVSDALKYVWVSQDGEVYTSADGASFTQTTTLAAGAGTWQLTAGDAGEVVAYRLGASTSVDLYRSTDSGTSWTAITQTSAPSYITSLAYAEGVWMATSTRSPWLWVSNDLTSWRALSPPVDSSVALYSVRWDGGAWTAAGNGFALQCGRASDPSAGLYVATDAPSTLSDAGSLRGRLLSTTAPTNGQALVWVAADSRWAPATITALPSAAAASEVPISTGAGTTYTARTMAQLRDLLFQTTAYTGAATGWTDVDGVGTADASGTDYDLSLASGETGASEVYPTSDHPRLHRDVSSQIGAEADWSVTFRVGALTGGGSGRLFVAVGKADDSAGVQILLDPATAVVEVGSWVSTSYTAAGTAAGAIAVDGTGWARLLCRGGVVSAQWGTGTSTDPPTVWTQVAGTVSVAGITASRLSLYLAQWAGTGITAAVDDVRVRAGA